MELKDIKGFGEKRIEALNNKGIFTPLDLLRVEPNKYLDYSCITGVDKHSENMQTIKVEILVPAKCAFFKGKSSVTTKCLDIVSNQVFTLIWYNQPFMKNNIRTEMVLFVTGKFNKLHQFVVYSQMACDKVNNAIIPVYGADIPAEDIVISDSIEQGDSVSHAKYGNGVVEKMIKYGSKTLYSINFDNVGRRLLDPTLTEIKKA